MRKAIVNVMCVLAVGIATAQMVTYLDNQGKPFMYSTVVDPINTPSFVFPMISPSLSGAVTPSAPALPALTPTPQLPTLKGL